MKVPGKCRQNTISFLFCTLRSMSLTFFFRFSCWLLLLSLACIALQFRTKAAFFYASSSTSTSYRMRFTCKEQKKKLYEMKTNGKLKEILNFFPRRLLFFSVPFTVSWLLFYYCCRHSQNHSRWRSEGEPCTRQTIFYSFVHFIFSLLLVDWCMSSPIFN